MVYTWCIRLIECKKCGYTDDFVLSKERELMTCNKCLERNSELIPNNSSLKALNLED